MSGGTVLEFAQRIVGLCYSKGDGACYAELAATAIAERDAATRRDALEEAAKICEKLAAAAYRIDEVTTPLGCLIHSPASKCHLRSAYAIRYTAAQQPCPARREE